MTDLKIILVVLFIILIAFITWIESGLICPKCKKRMVDWGDGTLICTFCGYKDS